MCKAREIAFGGALVLVYTAAAGGLAPDDRALVMGLVLLAAVMAPGMRRVALWGPAMAAAASLAFAPIPGLGWETLFQLAFFATAGGCLGGALDRPWGSAALIFAGTVLAFSVNIESARQVALLGRPGFGLGGAGFLLGANVSAVALAAALPAAAYGAAKGGVKGHLCMLAGVVIFLAVILTGSRTGLIAAAAGLLPFAFSLPARARRVFLGGVVLAVLAGALLYLPRFVAKLDPAFITNAQRFSMIRGVLEAAAERPLAGFGPGAFPILGQQFLTWPKWELHPHSLPLRILFESGTVGILGWGWLIVAAARRAREAYHDGRGVSLAVTTALLAGSITDDVLWIPGLGALFFVAIAGLFDETSRDRPAVRAAVAAAAILFGIAAGLLPAVENRAPGIAFEPNFRAIDRAVERSVEPDFRGWEEDPWAVRVGAYARWARGDRDGALRLVARARTLDPKMIFTPNLLDLAWLTEQAGDTAAARVFLDEARAISPVLVARYCGDTDVRPSRARQDAALARGGDTDVRPSRALGKARHPVAAEDTRSGSARQDAALARGGDTDVRPSRARQDAALARGGETVSAERSWIDRHYGIEFPDASIITAATMVKVADPLDWRHTRHEAMAAWERGDTPAARALVERAATLAATQYGRDPILLRMQAALETDARKAAGLLAAAEARAAPAYPYRIFAPLIYRKTPATSGENSPWWSSRMTWNPRPACP